MERYMDTTLTARERAELLLKEMTLDEKIAQLTGVFSLKGYEDKMAAFFKNGIGQISTLGFRMCESMEAAFGFTQVLAPVQLYLRDVQASMTRPNKELQGFARVELQPGEEKTVRFTVSPSQMAFVDEDMKWKIEKGEYEVQIAASSQDVRLTDSYVVTKNAWLEGRDRAFYAGVQIGE